jgi:hypothetical protein
LIEEERILNINKEDDVMKIIKPRAYVSELHSGDKLSTASLKHVKSNFTKIKTPIIYISGSAGSGKSVLGQRLAAELQMAYFEPKLLIENIVKKECDNLDFVPSYQSLHVYGQCTDPSTCKHRFKVKK